MTTPGTPGSGTARRTGVAVNPEEVEFSAVRASSLPEPVKARLLATADARLTDEGVIVIKAQEHRSLVRNRAAALERLQEMVDEAACVPKVRRATRPTRASVTRRLEEKARRAKVKTQRGGLVG